MATAARTLVLSELLRHDAADTYANLSFDAALDRAALSPADRAFATALFYGVLEHRITLDAAIDARADGKKIEPRVREILRLAFAQLLYFDRVPDHAAVNEAVEMAPARARGFVNAMLRSFCREGKKIPLPDADKDPAGYLSVRYSVSVPLAQTFSEIFGAARTKRLLEAFSRVPPVTVRVNTAKLTREAFLEKTEGAVPTPHAPYGVILPAGAPLRDLLDAGFCFVQDEASQLAVEALDVPRGARVLDLCAAPGSKSFGAALAAGDTGEVRAFDLHENKLSLIRAGAARLGLDTITAAAGDARRADPAALGTFPRVLCDVPCSGFGVLAKKPDIRYKPVENTAGLVAVQRDILNAAANLVETGGILVYATCTLLPRENEEQIAAFLAAHPAFSAEAFAVGGIEAPDGMLTLAPDTHGTDGFFIAKLRKKGI